MFLQGHGDINKNSLVNMQNRDDWVFCFVFTAEPHLVYLLYGYIRHYRQILTKWTENGCLLEHKGIKCGCYRDERCTSFPRQTQLFISDLI